MAKKGAEMWELRVHKIFIENTVEENQNEIKLLQVEDKSWWQESGDVSDEIPRGGAMRWGGCSANYFWIIQNNNTNNNTK